MISRDLLLVPSFTKKEAFKTLRNFFNTLYCKFRLARLCRVLADPVTNDLVVAARIRTVVTRTSAQ